MSRFIQSGVFCLLMIGFISIIVLAQDGTAPTVTYQAAYPDIQMTFTEVQLVIDLEPGAGFPLHHHGGFTMVLVLEGEVALQQDGTETIYHAGESWTETPSQIHTAINNGDQPARVFATFLLPPGTEALTVEEDAEIPAIAPTIVYQAAFPDLTMDGAFNGMQVELEFQPGAGIPHHTHGGPTLVTVLDGEITLVQDGVEHVYKAGESWTEMPTDVHEAFNAGDVPVHVAVTFLLPPDTDPTTIQGD